MLISQIFHIYSWLIVITQIIEFNVFLVVENECHKCLYKKNTREIFFIVHSVFQLNFFIKQDFVLRPGRNHDM